MSDADGDHPGKGIQITAPLFIINILHGSFDDHERLLIIGEQPRVKDLLSEGQDLFQGWTGIRFRLMVVRRQLGCRHNISSQGDSLETTLIPIILLKNRKDLICAHPERWFPGAGYQPSANRLKNAELS